MALPRLPVLKWINRDIKLCIPLLPLRSLPSSLSVSLLPPRPWRVAVCTSDDTLCTPPILPSPLYSTGVSARCFPLAKLFFQKFDYTPHMCNWFPCHVPSSRWQVINSAALTKCSHRALVFCVWTVCGCRCLEGQRLFPLPLSLFLSLVKVQMSYLVCRNPMSSLQLSHMDLINYLSRTSALCLAHMATSISAAMQIWLQRGNEVTGHGLEMTISGPFQAIWSSQNFLSPFDESFKVVPSFQLGKSQLQVFAKGRKTSVAVMWTN